MAKSSNAGGPILLFAIADTREAQALLTMAPQPWLCIQLRDRDAPTKSLYDVGTAIRNAGHRLCVNDRVDVALAVGAEAVQLGRGSMTVDEMRAIAPHLRIGRSVHTADEALSAKGEGADFCLLSTVFSTPGPGKGAPLGLDVLAEVAAACGAWPVYALGGINGENVVRCFEAGAAGVAAIRSSHELIACSALWLPSARP